MKKSYTAAEVASLLLCNSGLSDYQVGFLAVALDEVAEYHERIDSANKHIASYECADELTQMNSQHRGSIEGVVYALMGLSFSVSWHGEYGARTFFVDQHQKCDLMSRPDFDTLHDGCGWGSDAHRHALRTQFNTEQTA